MTTGITFGLANLISTTATIITSYAPTAGKTIGIYAALLISHGTVNTFGIRILGFLNTSSIILHSLGVSSLAIAVLAKAPTHQSAKFVFATFYDGTGADPASGWSVRASPAYVAACGVLMSQFTITGYDASAHVSEETRNASWNAPLGVLMSIGASSLFGFFLILSLLFSIQDFPNTVSSKIGQPVVQILIDIFGNNGAIALMTLVILYLALWPLFHDLQFPHDVRLQSGRRTPEILQQGGRSLSVANPNRLACGDSIVLARYSLARLVGCFHCRYIHSHNRSLHLLRAAHADRSRLPSKLQERPFQPRHRFSMGCSSRRSLDLFHKHHFLSTHCEPGDKPDTELYTRCCRYRRRMGVWKLVLVGQKMVHRADQADRS